MRVLPDNVQKSIGRITETSCICHLALCIIRVALEQICPSGETEIDVRRIFVNFYEKLVIVYV